MLRPVARRTFSTFTSRRFLNQLRGRSYLHGDSVDKSYYRVRIQKPPFFTTKNITRKIVRYVPIILLGYYLLPFSIEIVEEDSEKEAIVEDGSLELEDGEDEYDEEEGSGLFLPMTWPKPGPREFYRGTDPEWQEYIKLSKNKDRQKRIFDELVQVIRQMCSNGSNVSQALGTVDMTKGRHWLDVIFPPGPPRHYEQTGIEITTEYIAIATRELSEQEYNSIKRWFNPTAVLKSVTATCVEVFGLPADRLKTLFGTDNGQTSNPNSDPLLPSNSGQAGIPSGPIGFGPPTKGTSSPTPGTSKSNADGPDHSKPGNIHEMPELPGSSPGGAQSKLLKTFLSTFNARFSVDPPRGCIILSGLVECIGTRASTTVDVVACYDLFNDRFLLISPKLRRLTEYRQRPRGR